MRYPKINKQPRREVNIPQLSGGLNLRDSLTGIRDNQMTECVNMWYKEGMLKTRPPFVTNTLLINQNEEIENNKKVSTCFHSEIKVFYKGYDCIVASNKSVNTGEGVQTSCDIEFEFQAVDKVFVMPKISGILSEDITYFCAETSGILYCYVSDFSIWRLDYKKAEEEGQTELNWKNISLKERYAPTVYIHCKRNGWDDFEGVQFEGFNLIGNRYKMIYSAYNESDSDKSHPMRYYLAQELPETGEICVEVTSYDPNLEHMITTEHKIIYTKEEYDAFSNGEILIEKFNDLETPKDGLYLFVKYNYVGFLYEPEFTFENGVANIYSEEEIKKYACSEDNIVITAPYKANENDFKKVFCMTRETWFGGTANDINGGSRLFLCGNTQNEEKSLVLWSGINDPLYFGENCYAYIGSKSRAVTAFGKQGENLIVFKENKIYAARYTLNTDIDADDLINQKIVDYDANSVYFPFVLINGFIGCDCPDTIQMCRNRLVWATSEGKIYTLCTMSQYNEHTVYEISDMITPKLKEYKNHLKTATSADFDGHYILFLENCAFVMNYCCYGYQYVYSYSKSEDANELIPWYFWGFSFLNNNGQGYKYDLACINVLDCVLLMRAYFADLTSDQAAFVSFAMDEKEYSNFDSVFYKYVDGEGFKLKNSTIRCSAVTKLFELGNGIYNINIDNVAVKLGTSALKDIVVSTITEHGKETIIINGNRNNSSVKDVDFIKCKKLYPYMKNIVKFGMKFECEGHICIDGMSIKYRMLGGVK